MYQFDLAELHLAAQSSNPLGTPAVAVREQVGPFGTKVGTGIGLPNGSAGGHDHPASLLENPFGARPRAPRLATRRGQEGLEQCLDPGSAGRGAPGSGRDRVDGHVGEPLRMTGEQGAVTLADGGPLSVDIDFRQGEHHRACGTQDHIENGQFLAPEWRGGVEHHQHHAGVERVVDEIEGGLVEEAERVDEGGLARPTWSGDEELVSGVGPGHEPDGCCGIPPGNDIDGLRGQIRQLLRHPGPRTARVRLSSGLPPIRCQIRR